MPQIIDPFGNPVSKLPSKAKARARIVDSGASRNLWRSATGPLTPGSLARMLRDHAEGNMDAFLTFAEEAEERNEHYGAVLGVRKRAVEGCEFSVRPGGDTPRDKEIASFVSGLIDSPAFIDIVEDLLDALGKGFSVSEILWHVSADAWLPVEYVHIDPRHFQLDPADTRRLRIRARDRREGLEMLPYKFLVHFSKLKSGRPHRAALARAVAWTYLFQNFTIKDWVGYVETYGQPFRVGKYGKEATDEDVAELVRALQNIGTDAAAAIPQNMQIEFIKAANTSGSNFKELSEFCDKRISKAVLGQTMTTDDGSSQSQANVHDDVRTDIKRSDVRKLCATINEQLIRPVVDLNFGPQVHYPSLCAPVLDAEDLKEKREAIKDFTAMGLQVPRSYIHERWGIPQAGEGDDVLTPPATGASSLPPARAHAQPSPVATARRADLTTEDLLDELVADGLEGWRPMMAPLIDPVREAVGGASSYEDAIERLEAARESMSAGEVATALRDATAAARAVGDIRD